MSGWAIEAGKVCMTMQSRSSMLELVQHERAKARTTPALAASAAGEVASSGWSWTGGWYSLMANSSSCEGDSTAAQHRLGEIAQIDGEASSGNVSPDCARDEMLPSADGKLSDVRSSVDMMSERPSRDVIYTP